MGGYSPTEETSDTIAVIGRGGWAILEEIAQVQGWRSRRRRRRRLLLAALGTAVVVAPVVVSVWRP